ncbi:MAG: hypothetical protein JSR72_22755 [Proteobacteria bacterium]|nr:hypothetical protein [Pseudomonadota bacterium]
MDTLHDVLRSIKGESKAGAAARRDHLTVFREFLDHLDRAARRKSASSPQQRVARPKTRRGRK